jgi:hypothetical protein
MIMIVIIISVVMRSLHSAHEVKAYTAVLSVCQHYSFKNRCTHLDEILYGHYAIGHYLEIIFFCFLLLITNKMDERTCEVGLTLVPLCVGPYNDVWFSFLGKYKTLGH